MQLAPPRKLVLNGCQTQPQGALRPPPKPSHSIPSSPTSLSSRLPNSPIRLEGFFSKTGSSRARKPDVKTGWWEEKQRTRYLISSTVVNYKWGQRGKGKGASNVGSCATLHMAKSGRACIHEKDTTPHFRNFDRGPPQQFYHAAS